MKNRIAVRERRSNGQFANKLKTLWQQTKDLILVLFLLNALIGLAQQLDFKRNDKVVEATLPENPVEVVKVEAVMASQGGEENTTQNPPSISQIAEVSAFTADVAETDDDPITMASGKKVYEGAMANNCLDFGTKVRIEGKDYVVEDRLNSRYGCDNFDIYMPDKTQALQFGRKRLEYVIIN